MFCHFVKSKLILDINLSKIENKSYISLDEHSISKAQIFQNLWFPKLFCLKFCFFYIKNNAFASQIFLSFFICLYPGQSHIRKSDLTIISRIRSGRDFPCRTTLCITSVFSFFTFLLKKRREWPFVKHLPHGRCFAECFVHIISLNPHSNPMRKAVLSPFYSSGNSSSGGSVTCPGSPNHWMDYDLGSNCKAPGPSTKHATSHLENVLQDIFYFHSAILALFIYFHFELYKSSVRVLCGESHILKIYSKALLSLGRQFSFLMENFRSYCHYENTL